MPAETVNHMGLLKDYVRTIGGKPWHESSYVLIAPQNTAKSDAEMIVVSLSSLLLPTKESLEKKKVMKSPEARDVILLPQCFYMNRMPPDNPAVVICQARAELIHHYPKDSVFGAWLDPLLLPRSLEDAVSDILPEKKLLYGRIRKLYEECKSVCRVLFAQDDVKADQYVIYITEHEGKPQPTVSVTDLKTGQSLDVKDLSVEELLCSSIKAPEQMNEMRRLALIYLWKLYPLKMKRLSE